MGCQDIPEILLPLCHLFLMTMSDTRVEDNKKRGNNLNSAMPCQFVLCELYNCSAFCFHCLFPYGFSSSEVGYEIMDFRKIGRNLRTWDRPITRHLFFFSFGSTAQFRPWPPP
jgi:hypothetical protein